MEKERIIDYEVEQVLETPAEADGKGTKDNAGVELLGMWIVRNAIIPPSGFKALTVWPFIFCRKALKDADVSHEAIHGRQQKETIPFGILSAIALFLLGGGWWSLLALPFFYWWYGIEWVIRLVMYRNRKEAYRNISFEQESYGNEADFGYLNGRAPYAWASYLFRKTYNKKQ